MKALSQFSTAVVLAGSLLFATGCEKASVAPEMVVSNAQNAAPAKDRNVEVRVTGTLLAHMSNGAMVPAKAFTATLQIQDFAYGSAGLVGQGVLQQIGGGISAAYKTMLQTTTLSYTVTLPDYIYLSAPVNPFTFQIAQTGYSSDYTVGRLVQLDTAYPITINAYTRKFNQVSAQVDALNTYLWNTLHDGSNYYDGDDYTHAAGQLDAIADVIGRF